MYCPRGELGADARRRHGMDGVHLRSAEHLDDRGREHHEPRFGVDRQQRSVAAGGLLRCRKLQVQHRFQIARGIAGAEPGIDRFKQRTRILVVSHVDRQIERLAEVERHERGMPIRYGCLRVAGGLGKFGKEAIRDDAVEQPELPRQRHVPGAADQRYVRIRPGLADSQHGAHGEHHVADVIELEEEDAWPLGKRLRARNQGLNSWGRRGPSGWRAPSAAPATTS